MPPNDGDARKPPMGAASAFGGTRPNKSSFDQHSRFCVAIERLSNWHSALGRINALERRLDGSEAGLDDSG
jgi:hypothetical protein